jgi:putative salt-induced outer membrane protein YdiY
MTLDLKKVASINPPPHKWKGNIALGGSTQSGNTDRNSASVSAEAARKTDQDRFSLRFLFNYAEDESDMTARNTFGAAKYDYFFTPRFYGYLAMDLLNDKFANYRLRTAVGPGVGYQIWDDPVKSLLVEAGFSYIWENYYEGNDTDYPAARLGADFRWQIFKFLTFTDRILVYPNLKYGGEYLSRNEAALISPLGSGWALRLANIWERNSDPQPGFDKDDFTTLLALQYSF